MNSFLTKNKYNCKTHKYEKYSYYCEKCQKYICCNKKDTHKHKEDIFNFNNIIPNYDDSVEYKKIELSNLRYKLDLFKNQINKIESLFKTIIDNL